MPVTVYRKLDLVAELSMVNVHAAALNMPPVPVRRVQVPPLCSPVNKPYKSTTSLEPAQDVVLVPVPAFACAEMFTVATEASFGHGAVPVTVYVNVEVVAPAAGVNVPAAALNVPPVPVVRVQTPPVCSPVIRLNRSITVTELSQIEVEQMGKASAWEVI